MTAPNTFTFVEQATPEYIGVEPVNIKWDDQFTTASLLSQYATVELQGGGANGTITASGNGRLSYKGGTTWSAGIFKTNGSLPSSWQFAEITIGGFGGGAIDNIGVGFSDVTGANMLYVLAFGTGGVQMFKHVSGSETGLAGAAGSVYAAGTRLMAMIAGPFFSVWLDTGSGYVLQCQLNFSGIFDFQNTTVQNTFYPMAYIQQTVNKTAYVTRFRHGTAGNFHNFNNSASIRYLSDMTPVVRNGRSFFMGTVMAPSNADVTIVGASMMRTAVFSIDPNDLTQAPRVESLHTFSRKGRHAGDLIGTALYDETNKEWILFSASLDTGVDTPQLMFITKTKNDFLTGEHIHTGGLPIAVPVNTSQGYWDGDIIKVGSTWYCCYAKQGVGGSGFNPALASAPTMYGPYTAVGVADTAVGGEGETWIVTSSGTYFTTHKDSDDTLIVYDTAMTKLTGMTYTAVNKNSQLSFHASILSYIRTSDGRVGYILLADDGLLYSSQNWSEGHFSLQVATQTDPAFYTQRQYPNGTPAGGHAGGNALTLSLLS